MIATTHLLASSYHAYDIPKIVGVLFVVALVQTCVEERRKRRARR